MSEVLKVIVPEDIKQMSHEERHREIEKLEAEARKRRESKSSDKVSAILV